MGTIIWTPAACGVLLFIVHIALPAIYIPIVILHAWPIQLDTQVDALVRADTNAWTVNDKVNRIQADAVPPQYTVDVFFYSQGGVNLLEPMKVMKMKTLERSIESLPGYAQFCRKSPSARSRCLKRKSILNYIYPSIRWDDARRVPDVVADGEGEEQQPLFSVLSELQRLGVFWYTSKTFPSDLRSEIIRTRYEFAPVDGVVGVDGAEFEAGYGEFLQTELYPHLLGISSQRELNIGVSWESEEIRSYERDEALFQDISLLGGSVLVVFIGMALYSRSLFLAVNGLLAALSSLPLAYMTYVVLLGNETVNILNCVVVFIVLAAGTEGMFICQDVFVEAKLTRGQQQCHVCFGYATRRFSRKILLTSGISAAAFLTLMASPLHCLRGLGIFAALAVCFNCICLLAVLPPAFIVASPRQLKDVDNNAESKRETRTFFVDGEHEISKQASTSFVVHDEAEKASFQLKSTSGYHWASRKLHNVVAAYMWKFRRMFVCVGVVLACSVFATGICLVQQGTSNRRSFFTAQSVGLELSRKHYGSYGLETDEQVQSLLLPLCADSLGEMIICTHAPTPLPTVEPTAKPSVFHPETPAPSQRTAGPSSEESATPSASTTIIGAPTIAPTTSPSRHPSPNPTQAPTVSPSATPTQAPLECPCVGYSYCSTASTGDGLRKCTCLPGWTEVSNCSALDETFQTLPDTLTETLTFTWMEREGQSGTINWTAFQVEALEFCNRLDGAVQSLEQVLFRRLERCPIKQFATVWLPSKGNSFPIQDSEFLGLQLSAFTKQNTWAKDLLVVDADGAPLLIAVEIKTGIDSNIDTATGLELLAAWAEYTREEAISAQQTCPLWTRLETERSLTEWSIKAIGFVAGCTLVTLSIGLQRHLLLSLSVFFALCLISSCLFGWFVIILGSDITGESTVVVVFSVIVAINPSVYLANGVAESRRSSAYCRVRDALKTTGAPMLAAAVTVLVATVPLSFGRSNFAISFARVIASVSALRTLFAICFLPPWLMVVGNGNMCGESTDAKVVGNNRSGVSKTTTTSSVDLETKAECRQQLSK